MHWWLQRLHLLLVGMQMFLRAVMVERSWAHEKQSHTGAVLVPHSGGGKSDLAVIHKKMLIFY